MSEKTNSWAETKRKKEFARMEFRRRIEKYHIVYIALLGTGMLSITTGVLLPFSVEGAEFSIAMLLAALYFAVGFVSNGELAANFWFTKLTDHDQDNKWQVGIAITALFAAVLTSLITALAASVLIAYWLKIFPAFTGIPDWAQVYIVDIIPVMWVFHFVTGVAFKALSAEAEAERVAQGIIREKEIELIEAKEKAKVAWWEDNARSIYEEQGRKEAREFVEGRFNSPRKPAEATGQTLAFAKDVGEQKLAETPAESLSPIKAGRKQD